MTLSNATSNITQSNITQPLLSPLSIEFRESRNPVQVPAKQSLDEAAAEIVALAKAADDRVLLTATKVVALKQRILAGEAGPDAKWMAWLRVNVKLSESYLYDLVRIGESSDPEKALEAYRKDNREKSKKSSENRPRVKLNAKQKLLVRVISELPEQDVMELLNKYRGKYPHIFKETTHWSVNTNPRMCP